MQFINPQEAEAKVAARYRVIVIFWTAMLGSLAFLLILALVVPGSGKPNQTLTFALLGIGLTVVIISVIVKQSLLRQSIEKQQLQLLVNTYVISFAFMRIGCFIRIDGSFRNRLSLLPDRLHHRGSRYAAAFSEKGSRARSVVQKVLSHTGSMTGL